MITEQIHINEIKNTRNIKVEHKQYFNDAWETYRSYVISPDDHDYDKDMKAVSNDSEKDNVQLYFNGHLAK